jgi:hypothetical protein
MNVFLDLLYCLWQGDSICTQKGNFIVVTKEVTRNTDTIRLVPAEGYITPEDFRDVPIMEFINDYFPFCHSVFITKQYVLDAGANFKKVRSLT